MFGKRFRPFRRCLLLAAVLAATIVVPAQAQSGQNAYVASNGGGVFQYGIGGGGALAPLAPPSAATNGMAASVAAGFDGFSVYVAGGAGIDQYTQAIDGTLGQKNPPSVPVASGVEGITVAPGGKSVYATAGLQPTILQFDVGLGGTLAPKARPTVAVPASGFPGGIAVSPDGKSAYVSFYSPIPPNAASVAQFDVGAGGALTPKNPATVPAGSGPAGGVAVSPDGTSVYVVNTGGGTVSQYDVGARGTLTPKGVGAVGTAGDNPAFIALSPDGANAYVTNFGEPGSGGGSVAQYTVNADGTLSFKRPSIVGAGGNPLGIAVSADSASAYVSSGNAVFQFGVATGGGLVPKTTPSVPSGAQSRGLALSPLLPSAGADVLYGTAGDDVIRGRGGDDVIRGLGGDDVIIGGPGRDRLVGGPGRDRLHGGPGRDRIKGGPGRDVIDVRDGARDRVHCGDGRDVILADAADQLQSCERVRR